MTIPSSQSLPPEDPERLSPARRRRRQRMIFPGASDQRAIFLEELAHRVIPSADFFLMAILAVLVLGVAILMDIPALFFLAALLSPFMGPVLGLALSTATGARRFFLQSLGGISLGSLIYFLGGLCAGWFSTFVWKEVPVTPTQVFYHAAFSWPDLVVLSAGAIISALLLMQDKKQKPLVSSVALAYEIFLPIGVAGFGLTSGLPGLFSGAASVFGVHLFYAVLLCLVTLFAQGLRPREKWGFTLGTSTAMVLSAGLVFLGSISPLPLVGKNTPMAVALVKPALSSTVTPLKTAYLISATPSLSLHTLEPDVPTLTATNTLIPTPIPTETPTIVPTPVYAKINAKEGAGAVVREKPDYGSAVVKTLNNGSLVEILPDTIEVNGINWTKVRLPDNGHEAWIARFLLITATPER